MSTVRRLSGTGPPWERTQPFSVGSPSGVSRSWERETPDGEPTENGCVRSHGGPVPDQRRTVLMLPRYMRARIDHVREHDRRPAEHAVFQRHAVVDRDVVLDFDAGAHDGTGGDVDVLADGAPRTYRRPFRDMREMPHARSFSDRTRIVHAGRLVSQKCPLASHVVIPSLQR